MHTKDYLAQELRNKLGDAPIEQRHKRLMNSVADVLDETFNDDARGADRSVGFILMVFPLGDRYEGRCNYISNADRAGVVQLLKDQLQRFEEQDRMVVEE